MRQRQFVCVLASMVERDRFKKEDRSVREWFNEEPVSKLRDRGIILSLSFNCVIRELPIFMRGRPDLS